MHSHAEVRRGLPCRRAEFVVLLVDTLKKLPHKAHSLLVRRNVTGTDAEHERIRGLLLLQALEKAPAAQPQLRARLLGDGLHVLPYRAEDFARDTELGFLLNANVELALRLLGRWLRPSIRYIAAVRLRRRRLCP